MSLKRNTIVNFVGQTYATLIGIVLVPMYVKYIGAEAYGLIGFYAVLQAWLQLLDMGFTLAMARESALFQGGAVDPLSLRRLLRALEGIFLGIALTAAVIMMAGADFIASSWLKVQQLPLEEVRNAVMLMAITVAMRLVCGLYRGVINGLERLVWLSSLNIAIATGRFVLVIPLFLYVGTSPTLFFGYQLVVTLIELIILAMQTYRLLPKVASDQPILWEWEPLRKVFKFSLSISVAVLLYLAGTQADKLLLSNLLTLTDYAYFSLAVLVASGVLMLGAPLSGALLPRMTALNAEGNEAGLIRVYRNATQAIGVITIPAMLILAVFSEQVLWVWIGNAEIVDKAKSILTLYALANGFQVIGAMPYCLQLAKGDLKLHTIGAGLYTALLIPLVILGASHYGARGAGYACLGVNVIFFALWVPRIHRRFVKGLHSLWLMYDVAGIVAFPTVAALIMNEFITWPTSRFNGAIAIMIAGIFLGGIATISSTYLRNWIGSKWHAKFAK